MELPSVPGWILDLWSLVTRPAHELKQAHPLSRPCVDVAVHVEPAVSSDPTSFGVTVVVGQCKQPESCSHPVYPTWFFRRPQSPEIWERRRFASHDELVQWHGHFQTAHCDHTIRWLCVDPVAQLEQINQPPRWSLHKTTNGNGHEETVQAVVDPCQQWNDLAPWVRTYLEPQYESLVVAHQLNRSLAGQQATPMESSCAAAESVFWRQATLDRWRRSETWSAYTMAWISDTRWARRFRAWKRRAVNKFRRQPCSSG